jgi:transcriptional regulator with XRE-family HTH domain
MQTLHVIIPQMIRRIRQEKSMSQEDLAYLAGLDRTYISSVERGVRNITLKSLDKLLTALQIDMNTLATELIIQSRENKTQNE